MIYTHRRALQDYKVKLYFLPKAGENADTFSETMRAGREEDTKKDRRRLVLMSRLEIDTTPPPRKEKKPYKSLEDMLTTDEAAEVLGLAPSTLRTWRCTKAVQIPVVKIGTACRYRRSDLIRFIEKNTESDGEQ